VGCTLTKAEEITLHRELCCIDKKKGYAPIFENVPLVRREALLHNYDAWVVGGYRQKEILLSAKKGFRQFYKGIRLFGASHQVPRNRRLLASWEHSAPRVRRQPL
jgi:hypothetical protein